MKHSERARSVRGVRHISMGCVLGVACHTLAAAPQPDDYYAGVSIEAQSGRPLIEVQIPDIVYRTVTSTDLRDVTVFNAEGVAVPHALCESPVQAVPVITRQPLPVFELQAATQPGNGAHIAVNTPGGTAVRIEESQSDTPESSATQTRAHVIDARAVPDALRSIQFDWRSPDDVSEAEVRIEASEDLDRWRTVVQASTLLQVAQGEQQLRRESIPLPEQRYYFLRVVRVDGGPPLLIASVTAERVEAPVAIEPVWFTADAQASTSQASTDRGEWLFDAARLAPVTYARLRLPLDNMSLRVRIQSRNNSREVWRERWSGETYSILTEGERRTSPPAEIGATHDRYWRVLPANSSSVLDTSPALELGYRPARLQFMAQGGGPYTLAFGSRRAQLGPAQQCGSLISDARGDDLDRLMGSGQLGAQRTLGGALALQPAPKSTPVKRIVLWAVLVLGVALLVAMALSLLRRIRS